MRILGLDIGGSSVKLAGWRDGEVIWTGQSATYSLPGREELVTSIRTALQPSGFVPEAAGLCVPGLLDDSRRCVRLAVNLPGLVGIPLDDLVSDSVGCRLGSIRVVNDAVAAATDIAASRNLGGRLLVLALGTGVGTGVVDGLEPLWVEKDSCGHMGQIDVSMGDDPPVGPDGGAGSLEAYIGVRSLVHQYGDVEKFLWTATIDAPPLRALVRAIRIGHAIYRPQHIVLAGGVGIRLKHMIWPLQQQIEMNLTSVARQGWTLSAGDHDFHAAIGAARLASTTA